MAAGGEETPKRTRSSKRNKEAKETIKNDTERVPVSSPNGSRKRRFIVQKQNHKTTGATLRSKKGKANEPKQDNDLKSSSGSKPVSTYVPPFSRVVAKAESIENGSPGVEKGKGNFRSARQTTTKRKLRVKKSAQESKRTADELEPDLQLDRDRESESPKKLWDAGLDKKLPETAERGDEIILSENSKVLESHCSGIGQKGNNQLEGENQGIQRSSSHSCTEKSVTHDVHDCLEYIIQLVEAAIAPQAEMKEKLKDNNAQCSDGLQAVKASSTEELNCASHVAVVSKVVSASEGNLLNEHSENTASSNVSLAESTNPMEVSEVDQHLDDKSNRNGLETLCKAPISSIHLPLVEKKHLTKETCSAQCDVDVETNNEDTNDPEILCKALPVQLDHKHLAKETSSSAKCEINVGTDGQDIGPMTKKANILLSLVQSTNHLQSVPEFDDGNNHEALCKAPISPMHLSLLVKKTLTEKTCTSGECEVVNVGTDDYVAVGSAANTLLLTDKPVICTGAECETFDVGTDDRGPASPSTNTLLAKTRFTEKLSSCEQLEGNSNVFKAPMSPMHLSILKKSSTESEVDIETDDQDIGPISQSADILSDEMLLRGVEKDNLCEHLTGKSDEELLDVDVEGDLEYYMDCSDSQLVDVETLDTVAAPSSNQRTAGFLGVCKPGSVSGLDIPEQTQGASHIKHLMDELSSLKHYVKSSWREYEKVKRSGHGAFI